MKVKKEKVYYYLSKNDSNKIELYCFKNKISKKEFAEKIGISTNYLWHLQNGKRPITETFIKGIKSLNDAKLSTIISKAEKNI